MIFIYTTFDPHCEPTKHDREKPTAPVDSGSKVTPINVKISVIFVNLFFLKNVKGPKGGVQGSRKIQSDDRQEIFMIWGVFMGAENDGAISFLKFNRF